jgi:hypothetical protein
MSFRIVKGGERTFKAKVNFKMANDKAGFDSVSFTAQFIMLTTDELRAAEEMQAIELVRKVLVGLEGIIDADGNELTYNDDVKEAVLQEPTAVFNMARVYHDTVKQGMPRLKN